MKKFRLINERSSYSDLVRGYVVSSITGNSTEFNLQNLITGSIESAIESAEERHNIDFTDEQKQLLRNGQYVFVDTAKQKHLSERCLEVLQLVQQGIKQDEICMKLQTQSWKVLSCISQLQEAGRI